jgi:signal transduction histidine kinase
VLVARDGERIPVALSSAPLRDQAGNAMGVVVVVRDLREIEGMRRLMLTQARLAAVGELAAGIAHEINNPLAFVRSNLGLLESHWKQLEDPSGLSPDERQALAAEGRELLQEARAGVDRAGGIIRSVRRFTHTGQPARVPADVNELVEDALAMLRPQTRASGLVLEFHPGALPPVACTPQELRQVFLNLMTNAVDAVSGRGGRVSVSTRREGESVIVEVADDGCGMAPEVVERIFDPFFTTKEVGQGAGLGLTIAWHLIASHGGHVHVESSPGAGARFRVQLPAAPSAPA